MIKERHVLGLSGGKDSSALAMYMNDNFPNINIEYFFTDTGKELKETYAYLDKLESRLSKPIARLNDSRKDERVKNKFDKLLERYNNFLPSAQARWCTVTLKLKPFEQWIKPTLDAGGSVTTYIAIRADEDRLAYKPTNPLVKTKFPFIENNIDRKGVEDILINSGIGKPDYYKWRSRSGCTFCFFQKKIEWVRLSEKHPNAFKEAQYYEKQAIENKSPFTWCENETLDELIKPERKKKIIEDFEKSKQKLRDLKKKKLERNPFLKGEDIDIDDESDEDVSSSCLICHK